MSNYWTLDERPWVSGGDICNVSKERYPLLSSYCDAIIQDRPFYDM